MSDVVEGPIEWDAEDEYLANYGLTSIADQKVLDMCSEFTALQISVGIQTGDPNSCWTRLLVAECNRRALKRKP